MCIKTAQLKVENLTPQFFVLVTFTRSHETGLNQVLFSGACNIKLYGFAMYRKIDRFRSKLVGFLTFSVTSTGLNKHISLLQNLYITDL